MNNIENLLNCLILKEYDDIDRYLVDAVLEYNQIKQKDFWSNWVYPNGANPEDIQKDLMDYRDIMEQVSKVYMYISNGKFSKPNYNAEVIINEIDDNWELKEK